MKGSTQGEIEPMRGEIEMNIGKLRNSEGRVLDLYKSGNELSLDFHINESPKWNSSLLDF